MERASGILLSVSSLPSPYGIGTLGKSAYDFVDFLEAAGQKYWQMLPLGPVSYGDSPYQSFSSFAGNPYYIDLDMLISDGLLKKKEVLAYDFGDDPGKVDYGKIYSCRFELLAKAKNRGWERDTDEVAAFAAENPWLENYALFMALKRHFGMVSWIEWPEEALKRRVPAALAEYREKLAADVELFTYIQFLFYKQWKLLREYIHSKGIKIIGDVPIYAALDSADVWSEPWEFVLDENYTPVEVAGCPPDSFTADGQLWGNPLYDWDHMRRDGFGWWIRRIDGLARLYDIIRIDHFRGFDEYWAVPYGSKTAKGGCWKKGPGMELVGVLNNWFSGVSFIAEDLGFITPSVQKLLDDSGWPGMKVLEFAFDSREPSNYLPHFYNNNCICYTGTHDNETLIQWKTSADKADVSLAKKYLNLTDKEGFAFGIIRGGMSSVADLFIAQMQDYLGLGAEGRMNKPGEPQGWWRWRLKKEQIKGKDARALAGKIKEMTLMYGR
ncbi:MAG: 4-alpha-glucanotransferase [Lachnospiraceae bacterium]|nr:4-alpha-glucanotransferase [Lachnospiraceae bacterium]